MHANYPPTLLLQLYGGRFTGELVRYQLRGRLRYYFRPLPLELHALSSGERRNTRTMSSEEEKQAATIATSTSSDTTLPAAPVSSVSHGMDGGLHSWFRDAAAEVRWLFTTKEGLIGNYEFVLPNTTCSAETSDRHI